MASKAYLFLSTHIFTIRKILWTVATVSFVGALITSFWPGWRVWALLLGLEVLAGLVLILTKDIAVRQKGLRDQNKINDHQNWGSE